MGALAFLEGAEAMNLRHLALTALLLVLPSDTIADGIWNPVATSGAVWGDGINNAQGMGTPIVPPTPCGAGQLDFTDGCGTTLYMVILR